MENVAIFFFHRYPKPGTQNPIASLKIADLADPKNFRIREIKPPVFLINEWVFDLVFHITRLLSTAFPCRTLIKFVPCGNFRIEQILFIYFPNQSCRIVICDDEHVWTQNTSWSTQCILVLNKLKIANFHWVYCGHCHFIWNTISLLPMVYRPKCSTFDVAFESFTKWMFPLFMHFLCRFLCRDHYFTSATWITPTELCVIWLNRPQNVSVVTVCKSPLWICQEVIQFEKKKRQSIANPFTCFTLLPLNLSRFSIRDYSSCGSIHKTKNTLPQCKTFM